MPPGDLFWHLSNFVALPLLFGVLATLAACWVLPAARRNVARLAAAAAAAALLVQVGGLLVLGAEGRIATYATMVTVVMLLLGWLARPR